MNRKPTPSFVEYIKKPITSNQKIKEICRLLIKGVVVLLVLGTGVGVLSTILYNIFSN